MTINLLANDMDVDNQLNPGSVTIVTQPGRGTVVNNHDGTVTYTSKRLRAGTDMFSYRVSDVSDAVSNRANIKIDIFRR